MHEVNSWHFYLRFRVLCWDDLRTYRLHSLRFWEGPLLFLRGELIRSSNYVEYVLPINSTLLHEYVYFPPSTREKYQYRYIMYYIILLYVSENIPTAHMH